ncbi:MULTISPECIES: extracellular solute-binding protein [unclassified Kitasatospora]|uniref:vWA domain-containing protein n=1 Tax=unclassified Kitasatospora TaxID=2633591 RepID=UPI000AEB271A|nr:MULTISPECIES: extracellular solute-binding protein [unclassified Kitasatospora]
MLRRIVPALLTLALAATACTSEPATPDPAPNPSKDGVLRVLAGSELQDMAPVLAEAKKVTGVSVEFTWTGSLDGADTVAAGQADAKYDAVWFPSNRYLRLDTAAKGKLLSETPVMTTPVAVGVRSGMLSELGWGDGSQVTWGQLGDAAAAGKLSYGMADPSRSNSGFSALVALASAFSGAGSALSDADVSKAAPSLQRFFSGQRLTSGSSGWLAEAYQKPGQNKVGALVNYESVLLSMNRTLPEADRLTVIRPVDGVISADYPLSLLASAGQPAQDSFQRLAKYLTTAETQQKISAATLRRPVTPNVTPAAGVPTDLRRELPFPGSRAVADGLLSTYQNDLRRPSRTVYVLDTSGSMKGPRLEALKTAMTRLTGLQDPRGVRRFREREEVTLIEFASKVKSERTYTVPDKAPAAELARIESDVRAMQANEGTAVYSSLREAYELLTRQQAAAGDDRFTSIVLMTDGESNEGMKEAEFRGWFGGLTERQRAVPVFPIQFGDAAKAQLQGIAELTGGKLFDGTGSLDGAFEEIRGYQ